MDAETKRLVAELRAKAERGPWPRIDCRDLLRLLDALESEYRRGVEDAADRVLEYTSGRIRFRDIEYISDWVRAFAAEESDRE